MTINKKYEETLKTLKIRGCRLFYQPDERENMRSHLKFTRKNSRQNGITSPLFSFSERINRKMDDALVELEKLLEERYADTEGLSTPEYKEHLCSVVSYIGYYPWVRTNYSNVQSICLMLYVAAKWIAKEIANAGKAEEMEQILKEEEKTEGVDTMLPPPSVDTEFPESTLRLIARILQRRNIYEMNKFKEDRGRYERLLLNNAEAEGRFNDKDEHRDRYLRLISLIPESSIKGAMESLEEVGYNLADITIKETAPYNVRLKQTEKVFVEKVELHNRKVDQYLKEAQELGRVTQTKSIEEVAHSVINDMRNKQLSGSGHFIKNMTDFSHSEAGFREALRDVNGGRDPFHLEELRAISDKADSLYNEIENIYNQRCEHIFKMLALSAHVHSLRKCKDLVNEGAEEGQAEMVEMLIPVEDPYALSFAFLWGLENNNVWTWAAGFGELLMNRIFRLTPWSVSERNEESITRRINEVNLTRAREDRYTISKDDEGKIQVKDRDDFVVCKIVDSVKQEEEKKDEDTQEELPPLDIGFLADDFAIHNKKDGTYYGYEQLLYRETGFLLPAANDYIRKVYDAYINAGMEASKATIMAFMSGALHASRSKYADIVSGSKEATNDEEEKQAEIHSLEESLRDAEARIAKEKDRLYEAEKRIRELEEELEEKKRDSEMEQKELAELREIVFLLESGEETEEQAEDEVEWPYDVQKPTVVFGGHDSWARAITPMLKGDIRFIDKDAAYHFDTKLLKKAESIWIQANAISHSAYYRIMDTARLLHKQIHYFTNASATICARQLVEIDSQ